MPEIQDRYYTELDKKIQEISMVDYPTFVKLVGEKAIDRAKICLLKAQGLSMQQVGNKLNFSKPKVQRACEECVSVFNTIKLF